MRGIPVMPAYLLLVCFTVAESQATITGVSGDVVIVAPPASAEEGGYESDTEIRVFVEVQHLTLPPM